MAEQKQVGSEADVGRSEVGDENATGANVPFQAEAWGTPIEREPEHIPEVPPDLTSPAIERALRERSTGAPSQATHALVRQRQEVLSAAAPTDLIDDLPTSSRAAEVRTAVEMADTIAAERDRYRRALADLKDYADGAIAGSGRWSPLEVANTIRQVFRDA